MKWGSLSEFLAMGGYGFYVWVSFGTTALCMVWEVLSLRRRGAMALRIESSEEGENHG
ncbi:MAG: heme exporter protein CcmD [Nitrospira sp.]|jgi:heme exporter protein D|nr:heme exporter protein CcmD [Nitrospira sp.]